MSATRARLALLGAIGIWGTIGLLRRFLPVPSGFLAMTRGLLGAGFLLLLVLLRGRRPAWGAIRANAPLLLLSGALIGGNWMLLFEAYRFTSVAVAELCYYMAPVFILLAAPFALRERLTARKLLCVAAALAGMALVSGAADGALARGADRRGVLLGLAAAALYAAVVLLNKRIRGVDAYDKTIVQLAAAGAVLLPYVLAAETVSAAALTPAVLALLAVVGVVHTGVAYALYFGAMDALPAHTVALLGYLDPVLAVLLSALLLREPLSMAQALGAALILLAAAVAELPARAGAVKGEKENDP